MITKEYNPGGIYDYISDVDTDARITYTPDEINVLESHGWDISKPGEYCKDVCFGAHEMAFDVIVRFSGQQQAWQDIKDFALGNPQISQYLTVNLASPIIQLYTYATKILSGSKFGQSEGEDVPAEIVMTESDGGGTEIDWKVNGEVVASDALMNFVNAVALAVTYDGIDTITGYAFIYYYNSKIWTSGLKNDADVINILNNAGTLGKTQTVPVWETEKGEFIFSKIYGESGNETYTGVAARDTSYTIDYDLINQILINNCESYGGWLGTDVVEWLTEGKGWDWLLNDPSADGVNVDIPASDGHTYNISYDAATYSFIAKVDNVEVSRCAFNTTAKAYGRNDGAKIYLTWYKQNSAFENKQQIEWVSISHNVQGLYYEFDPFFGFNNTDFKYKNNIDESDDYYNGYEGGGEPEEPQEEPDDIQDPAVDPLASGFLYAFSVSENDMINLADALVPDTLAQKLRADFGNNLYEFIVSYHLMPCLTNADSLNKTFIAYRGTPFLYGENNQQLALAPITKSWYKVSCGTRICMPQNVRQDGFENWAQANIQLYLPFIGFVHLNTADVWNKSITIVYNFDILQGTCVANIGVGSKGTIYSYEGVCKYSIPFTTAIDHSNQQLLSGIFASAGAAVSIGGVVAGGSPTGLLNAAAGISNAAGDFISAAEHKSTINRGGCLSGAPGWNMARQPALIITVPNVIDVTSGGYRDITGYPTFRTGTLVSYTNNYVEVAQIDLKAFPNVNNAAPNDNELDLINSTLKGGVYV